MPAVQRTGKTSVANSDTSSKNATSTMVSSRPSSRARPDAYLLLIFPLILAAGSLFALISPTASLPAPIEPVAPGIVSEIYTPHVPAVNYFAGKRNLLNVYFVKYGWVWTTLSFVLLHLTTRPPTSQTQKHYITSFTRYALITVSWILTTQWFFGPALIDRSFRVTGGYCETPPPKILTKTPSLSDVDYSNISSAPACKMARGIWRGGHDISGHVFMLTLSSAFLIYELAIADSASSHPSVSPSAAAKLASSLSEEEKKAVGGWESEQTAKIRIYSRYFLYAVVALDLWMLLMTAIWFHTWLEKVSGLCIAAGSLWGVYFLGEMVPAWKAIVGDV